MDNFDPKTNLVWVDMEMTGLNPDFDRPIQLGVVVTNQHLDVLFEGIELVIHQPEEVISQANDFVKEKLRDILLKSTESKISEADAEDLILAKIHTYVDEKSSPLCGNSVWNDRRFISKYLPKLDNFLHYRNIDVSTLKELCRRWRPDIKPFEKKRTHTALEDIKESIAELKYYREVGFIG